MSDGEVEMAGTGRLSGTYIDKEKVDTGMRLGIPVKASPTDTNL